MVTTGFHPTDSYAQAAAEVTDHKRLVANFEKAVTKRGRADVELLAAIAIARVELLERQLDAEGLRRLSAAARVARTESVSNVVPLRRRQTRAPAPGTGRPGA